MKKLSVIVLILVFTSSFSFAQQKYVGWSTGYYTSWSQGGYPPSKINWKAFTHICHFSCGPRTDGTISGLGGTSSTNLITEAHKNGVKVLVCVGGAGSGGNFAGAANATNRSKFISNIIKFMKQYGYDGVDLDWEELNGADASYVALHKDMRDSLNKISPRPLFTVAMADYLANVCGQIWQSVDQMNSMTYWTQVSGLDGDFSPLLNKGIPKVVLGVGLGFATEDGEIDITPALCKAKVIYTLEKGYGGIMMWAIDKDASRNNGATPCLDTIAHYVNKTAVAIMTSNQVRYEKQVSLFIRNKEKGGLQEIRYSIPVASGPAFVDLGVYDMKGALVKTLVRGRSMPGSFTVPLGQNSSGTYIIRLSTNSGTEAAKSFMIK